MTDYTPEELMAMAQSHLDKIVRYRIEGPTTTTTTTATTTPTTTPTTTATTTTLEPIKLTLDGNFGQIVVCVGLGLVAIVLVIILKKWRSCCRKPSPRPI
jgi:hypothetical protein